MNILNEAKEKIRTENLSKSQHEQHGEKKKQAQTDASKKTHSNNVKKSHNSKPVHIEQPHPQHYKTIEIKETYFDYDQNKKNLSALTYYKPKSDGNYNILLAQTKRKFFSN